MKHRVLIVDDDKDHAESIADLLQLRGYEVEVAFSGEQALERFRTREPEVTVMDVKLPAMNGVETFFQFRKLRPGAQVIMMTGLSVDQLIARAVEGGAAAVLHKPFAMADLLKAFSQVRPAGLLLVANHEPQFAQATADYLNANGYRAAVAPACRPALNKAISDGIDCLMLDRMPLLAGIESFLKLREEGCSVPTILVSPYEHEAPEWLARERILIKPFDPALLVGAVKHALELRRVESA
jgi:two-component system, NtrC family, response regulator HydG